VAEGPALEKRYPVYPGSWVRIPPSPPFSVRDDATGAIAIALILNARAAETSFFACGEMSELAEGARLEIVCVAYNGTEGSNPSLSAIFLPAHRLIILPF
jgi:hypothetical protein